MNKREEDLELWESQLERREFLLRRRDKVADQRDRIADERELEADKREKLADERKGRRPSGNASAYDASTNASIVRRREPAGSRLTWTAR